jgi:hypothetical protein
MALGVISWPTNVVAKLSAIANIHNYRRLLMAMEVHGELGRDMDCFIRERVRLFQDR